MPRREGRRIHRSIVAAGPQASEAEIAHLEWWIGHALPPDYRAFLQRWNGAQLFAIDSGSGFVDPNPSLFGAEMVPRRQDYLQDRRVLVIGMLDDEAYFVLDRRRPDAPDWPVWWADEGETAEGLLLQPPIAGSFAEFIQRYVAAQGESYWEPWTSAGTTNAPPPGSSLPVQKLVPTDTRTRRCTVCGVPIPAEIASGQLCSYHHRDLAARQQVGMAADELDASCGDTLATWRDNSAEMRGGLPAAQFQFRHRQDGWLLFRLTKTPAAGLSGQGWRTDWLAIHTGSGERRRFAQIPEVDVWFDLLGIRRVPERDNPLERWGQPPPPPEPRVSMAGMASPEPRRPSPAELVAGADTPVYGLVGSPLGLALSGLGTQNWSGRNEITSLTFADHLTAEHDPSRNEETLQAVRSRLMDEAPHWHAGSSRGQGWAFGTTRATRRGTGPAVPQRRPPLPARVVVVESAYHLTYDVGPPGAVEARFHRDMIAPKLFDGLPVDVTAALGKDRCKLHCTLAGALLWRCGPDLLDEIAASGAQLLQRSLTIEGDVFAAELLGWPQPRPLCAFQLERDEVGPVRSVLGGAAYGIPSEQLAEILQGLVIINHRDELLAQYRSDLDEQRRRLQTPPP